MSQEDLDLLRPFQSHLPANMRERMQGSEVELSRRAKAEVDKNRRRVALLSGLLVVALIGLGFAWWQYGVANSAKILAQQNEKEANDAKKDANQKLIQALKEKLSRLEIETKNAKRALAVYLKADDNKLIKETKQQIEDLKNQIANTEIEINAVK